MPAPGFVPLPSGGNPAPNPAGFAQSAEGAYGQGLQFASALRAAAAQQQQQQQVQNQQSLKDQFETELKLRKDGYTPYMNTTTQPQSPSENSPGQLGRRDPQPNVDPNSVIQDHFGRKWVAPPPAPAKDAATPQQNFTDTSNLLEKGARPVDAGGNVPQDTNTPRFRMDEQGNTTDTGMFGVNAAPPQGTTVTPPGGQQAYYVPPPDETLAGKLRTENAAAAAKPGAPHIDTEHFSSPVMIDPKTGQGTAITMPDGVTHNEKPEKPSKFALSYHTDDNGTVHALRGNAETGEVKEVAAIKGAGAKKAAAMANAPAPPMGGPQAAQKTGDDFLKGLPAGDAAILKGMSNGSITAPSANSRSPRAQQLLSGLMQYDPGFTTQRAQIRKSFTTGPDGKNIGALNTAIVHLGRLGDTAEALQNGSFTPGNELFNYVKDKFGSATTTNFGLLKDAVAGEMAASLKGNATDVEIEKMGKSIRASNSPEQMHGVVSEGMAILKDKSNTYDERYHALVQDPNDKWSAILPSAKAQLQKHGQAKAAAAGAGGGKTQPQKGDVQTHMGAKYVFDGHQYVRQ